MKIFIIGLGLIISLFAICAIYSGKDKGWKLSVGFPGSSIESDSLDDGNVFSRLLQAKSTSNNDEDIQSYNEEILSQLKDESFWKKKIEETIGKEINEYHNTKGEIKLLGYGLLCNEYTEDLRNCEYYVGFSNKVENSRFGGNTSYQVYGVNTSSHSINGFGYNVAAKQIAMNDIGNGGVFYNIDKGHVAGEYLYDEDIIEKYLGKDFEAQYEGNFNFIETVELVTNNDDGTSTFYEYIIGDETGEILFKKSENIISIKEAKDIIMETTGISTSNFGYLYLDPENLIYKSNFSYSGHTYDFKIDARDGTILDDADEIDIGDEKAMEIALKDSGLKASSLWRDISHGHGEMRMLLIPEVTREGIGVNAVYNVEIGTENGMVYYYQISATDGKILLKQLSE